jgi:type IV secretory pathway VirB10-like protein
MIGLILLALLSQDTRLSTQADVATTSTSILPKGTGIPIALINRVSTKNIQEGANVYATTTIPISDGKRMVIPAGTSVLGKVIAAERAGRVKGKAQLTISFQFLILPSGVKVPIYASLGSSDTGKRKGEASIEAEPGKDGEDIAVSGARGAAGGAVVGAVSRGTSVRTGVAVGAGAGLAAGLAEALIRRGDDLTLERGTVIEIVLDQDLDLS